MFYDVLRIAIFEVIDLEEENNNRCFIRI